MLNKTALSLLAALLLALTLGTRANAQAPTLIDLSGTETLKISSCGKDGSSVSLLLVLFDNGTWSADAGSDEYEGTYTTSGTSATLTLNLESLEEIEEDVESGAAELCDAAVNVTSVSVNTAQLKLNKTRTKAKLNLSVTATGSTSSGSGTAKYQVKAAGSVRPSTS